MARKFSALQYGISNCDCGEEVVIGVSWTTANPGRRFFGCRKYGIHPDACGFFLWVDRPDRGGSNGDCNGLVRVIMYLLVGFVMGFIFGKY
ncbi:hypothetical protein M5689_000893 [Euphorbia peplus]|nr:hypothetical protein M5689_000893 [Euphorbia peplus]